MKFIEDLLDKLFSGKSNHAIIRENFSITEEEEKEVAFWMLTEEGAGIFKMIYDNYHLKQANIVKSPEIHIFHSSYANGFAITFGEPLTAENFPKLFFGLGQRMLNLGYRKVSLERKTDLINDQVRTTEKFYLKPPVSADDLTAKINQLYGNISIEKIYLDNKPNYLKVLVTLYSDRQYHDAKPFDQLMDKLFKAD
jgi:hypothetical protein